MTETNLINSHKKNLLVCDTAYTYEILIDRNLQEFVTSKNLNGYFNHVWTVHAVASLFCSKDSESRYGRPVLRKLNESHTHIEGKVGRYKSLAWFPILNFILAQVDLVLLLNELVKKNSINIVRAEDPGFNGLLGILISYLNKLPLVVGVWGNPGAIRKNTKELVSPRFKWMWLEELVEKFVLRRANIVLSQNNDNRDFVLGLGVDSHKSVITRIGSALDPVHFLAPSERDSGYADLEELGLADQTVLMGIFRLEKLKLPHHLIHVAHLLSKKGYTAKVLFVGDGSMREELVTLSKELGVGDQVVFCGNRDQLWLSRVIPLVTVVVSTLTGRALAEAALGGAPIVAYDIDWHAEAIETGLTGELVQYGDISSMARSIEKILNDKVYSKTIGDNARDRMLRLMDPQASDEILRNAYESLMVLKK